MKKILVPVDFSAASANAAHYAGSLACSIQAKVELINVFQVPVESPMTASLIGPQEGYEIIENQSQENLQALAMEISCRLRDSYEVLDFKPLITAHNVMGEVNEEVNRYFQSEKMNLVIAGIKRRPGVWKALLGSNVRRMIERKDLPLMLIPEDYTYKKIRKIAFATDLSSTDVKLLCSLVELARPFNAEILIMHTTDPKFDHVHDKERAENFLGEVAGKVDYRRIYYRHVNSAKVRAGLEWVVEHGQIDVLAMVPRSHSFIERILRGSYTKQMAGHINLPLLIFPEHHSAPL